MRNEKQIFNLLPAKSKWLTYGLPLLGISCFIIAELGMMLLANIAPTLKGLLIYLLDIVTFYFILFKIFPISSKKGYLFYFVLALILALVAHLLVRWGILLLPIGKEIKESPGTFLALSIWRYLITIALALIFWLFSLHERRLKEKINLDAERLETLREKERIENSMYQLRLNPHLVLNALSYIQTYTENLVPKVAEAMDSIAVMIRYTMTDIKEVKKVTLRQEIEQIEQQARLYEKLHYKPLCIAWQIQLEGGSETLEIPPFILLTIIDNLYKYGLTKDKFFPAMVWISVSNGVLEFSTFNYKRRLIIPGSGMGLHSVKCILEYYYPGQHQLSIIDKEDTYRLELKITL